jgi:hypothetical protein
MTKRELIEKLKNVKDDDEIEIYIHMLNPLVEKDEEIRFDYEYLMLEFEVDTESGWDGLVTLVPTKIMGC